jgi:hypothetical protein
MGHLANPFGLGWFGGRHGRGTVSAVGLRVRYAIGDAPLSSLHTVDDSLRQHVRPLVDGLVGNANGSRRSSYRAPQEFDGFSLSHRRIEP